MGDQWERLKGKTYPDRLAEQLTALETDETLVSYKKTESGWRKTRIARELLTPGKGARCNESNTLFHFTHHHFNTMSTA